MAHSWSQRSHDDLWRGRSVSSHSGAQNGASSHLRLYFKDKIVVAILSNRDVDGADPGKLADTIGSIVLKGE